ncbi:ATP-grasp domain-containing protein [Schizothecium vesticola]|uniref:ATP-grasp domain-containing protein n=1 Tax=Schizothecium vesticola TaxID=314040 RepID=A0AA40BNY3_9PEZI|nr:ATP-grasp domain-containing protein [Schizothecium vesticola]
MEANLARHLDVGEGTSTFACTAHHHSIPPRTPGATAFWALHLDVLVSSRSAGSDPKSHHVTLPSSSGLARFLTSIRKAAAPKTASVSICLILPLDNGYVARSDFLQRRLECWEPALQTASFVPPTSFVEWVPFPAGGLSWTDLSVIVSRAVGVIHLCHGTPASDIDRELRNRLSFPWLLPDPIRPRRIAWVQGREDLQSIGRALEAAAALGIKLVILDEPGHWLQSSDSPGVHLREAFVEVDITPDSGLSGRVVAAVGSYPEPIDGVVTISDVRLAAVARASRELGLPTESPEAYDIAANKGRTRMLEEELRMGAVGATDTGVGKESFVLRHAGDLQSFLEGSSLDFPRIVKPVVGWSSECVSRVESEAELVAAVQRAADRHASSPTPSTAVVVEPYVAGPEVDANLVVLDGEVLFCDISDDFPSEADRAGAGLWANFEETQNVMPSALPASEQVGIREQLLRSVVAQGFKTGVFHCEARVRNSRYAYRANQEDGIVDLVPDAAATESNGEPVDVYLHEINARPPGWLETAAVLLAYGVDYYALRMLTAIGDDEAARIRALSKPFLDGPQFHLSVLMVHQGLAGVMRSRDAVGEYLDGHPDVQANVVDFYSRKKGGDVLEGHGSAALCWVGFLSVVSRESRRDLLRRVEHVAGQLTYEMETEDGRLMRVRGLSGKGLFALD